MFSLLLLCLAAPLACSAKPIPFADRVDIARISFDMGSPVLSTPGDLSIQKGITARAYAIDAYTVTNRRTSTNLHLIQGYITRSSIGIHRRLP
jgi:hypothetical protein